MSGVRPNRHRYLMSLADELHVQSTRVRDLIGDAHFLTDGHHKEYLLIGVLQRHLPVGTVAARGFVISPTDPDDVSTEQDILVVDTMQEAPVFCQGGVVIAFPQSVRAAISVKTKLDNDSVKDSVAGLSTVRRVASGHVDPRSVWCGAYYFDVADAVLANPALVFGQVSRAVGLHPVPTPLTPPPHACPLGPDLHCSARELAFKLEHGYTGDQAVTVHARLRGYRCGGLATAIFMGELFDHLAAGRGATAEFTRFADAEGVEPLGDQELAPQGGG